jgi:hypothetical protein
MYLDTIPDIEFKKAFFGIWISNNPMDKMSELMRKPGAMEKWFGRR